MKKVLIAVLAFAVFGCAAVTVEQSIKSLTYQKDPMSGAEFWVVWRTPTVQFMDPMFDKYEINSYMKCVKSGDNFSVSMATQSGAEPILDKYEFAVKGGEPIYINVGKHTERKAAIYRGDEGHMDLYEIDFSNDDIKKLVQVASTPGIRMRPIGVNNDKFVSKKLSDTERTQISAILTVCRFM